LVGQYTYKKSIGESRLVPGTDEKPGSLAAVDRNKLAEDRTEWRSKFEFHINGRGSNTGVHKYRALYRGLTTFSKVAPNISGSPAWNLLCVTLLAPSIL
jgi:hypothetical protein